MEKVKHRKGRGAGYMKLCENSKLIKHEIKNQSTFLYSQITKFVF
jgi:hypothetical protein